MGTFHVDCTIENLVDRGRTTAVSGMLVDTESEDTWVPSSVLQQIGVKREQKDLTFVMANGQHVTRSIGFAIVRTGDAFTVDEVVFAEEGDLLLLGSRSLKGMNLTVDPAGKRLVAAGPLPAGAAGPFPDDLRQRSTASLAFVTVGANP
jgi:predicted aspartyl protease